MDVDHANDYTQRLPTETLSLVFDHVGIGDIIRCSCVGRRWREVAIQHRGYWSTIYVTDSDLQDPKDEDEARRGENRVRASLELAAAQLSRSTALPISVAITLHGIYDDLECLLKLVAENLRRINDLILAVDIRYEMALFAVLARPAPIIETLAIEIYGGNMRPSLQPDFLGGFAPQLNHLALRNVYMPNMPVPHIRSLPELAVTAFTRKQQNDLSANVRDFPEHIFTIFPDLLQLELNAYPFFQIPECPSPIMSAGLSRLQRLHLWNSPPPRFLEWSELAAIGKLSVYEPEAEVIPPIAKHFSGEIAMIIDRIHNGHQFFTLTEYNTRERRWYSPLHSGVDYEKMRLRKMLFTSMECGITPDWAAACSDALRRIASLCCPAVYLAPLCLALGSMPALRDLIVRVEENDGLYDVPVPLEAAPSLRRILFEHSRKDLDIVLQADDVVELIEKALPSNVFGRIRLHLNGVRIEGWTEQHSARKIFRPESGSSDDDTPSPDIHVDFAQLVVDDDAPRHLC